MRLEKEIRKQIEKIKSDYAHVLEIPPASVIINAPRALMQIAAKKELDVLYYVLEEKRPIFACDDFKKLDY